MLKLIICCGGKLNFNGHKRRKYQWNDTYKKYVWENRTLTHEEFNQVVELAFQKNYDLRPYAMVVEVADETPAVPTTDVAALRARHHEVSEQARAIELKNKLLADEVAALKEQLATTQSALGEVVPSDAPAPTLDDALRIVELLAPERLKKKSGPKSEPAT